MKRKLITAILLASVITAPFGSSAVANTDREAAKASYRQAVEAFKAEMTAYRTAREAVKQQLEDAKTAWEGIKSSAEREAKKAARTAFQETRSSILASLPAKPTRPTRPGK
ncbi:MAG: hypothetical protein ACO3YA_01640 [Candidatus Nanopelagicaceae bacterium]|jgi:phage-related tail protein